MTKTTLTPDEIVTLIRSDVRVGRGTCSTLDECCDAADLVRLFGHLTTRAAVLRAAHRHEGLQIDRMLDQRFGDDSDVELKIAAEWRNRLGETKGQAKARRARDRRARAKTTRAQCSMIVDAFRGPDK